MSSTKPKIHNLLQCHQRRSEPQSHSTYTENLVKFGSVVFEICDWTDRHNCTSQYFAPSQGLCYNSYSCSLNWTQLPNCNGLFNTGVNGCTAWTLSVSWRSYVRKHWRLEHSVPWYLVTGRMAVLVLFSWLVPSLPRPNNLQTFSSSTVLTCVQYFCQAYSTVCYIFYSFSKLLILAINVNCSGF